MTIAIVILVLLVELSVFVCSTTDSEYVNVRRIGVLSEAIQFRANETKLLLRTENLTLTYRTCLQYRFYVEGKRTKLNSWLCRRSAGGQCSFDQFRQTDGRTRCHFLRPWRRTPDVYTFFFAFRRRRRRWTEMDEEEQKRRRRLRRRHIKSRAERVVGILQVDGLVDCFDACVPDSNEQHTHLLDYIDFNP